MKQKSPTEARTKQYYLKYSQRLKMESQRHRKVATPSEEIFWNKVLSRDKTGYRFLRQKPIGRFILDFYCSKLLIDIEIDGSSHNEKCTYDNERDKYMVIRGIKTIRYRNEDVAGNISGIIEDLRNKINERLLELNI